MTINESLDDSTELLKRASIEDANIKIEHHIAGSVDFLDVTITNEHGRLRTSVYHKSAAEPDMPLILNDHPPRSISK